MGTLFFYLYWPQDGQVNPTTQLWLLLLISYVSSCSSPEVFRGWLRVDDRGLVDPTWAALSTTGFIQPSPMSWGILGLAAAAEEKVMDTVVFRHRWIPGHSIWKLLIFSHQLILVFYILPIRNLRFREGTDFVPGHRNFNRVGEMSSTLPVILFPPCHATAEPVKST